MHFIYVILKWNVDVESVTHKHQCWFGAIKHIYYHYVVIYIV